MKSTQIVSEATRKRLQYEKELKSLLEKTMKLVRENSFVPDADVTDEMVLGTIVSQVMRWSGTGILETASYALQDANFHEEAAEVKKMAYIYY